MNKIEWDVDDKMDRYPKWKQKEINNCKHKWSRNYGNEMISGRPYRECLLCGLPQYQKGDLLE